MILFNEVTMDKATFNNSFYVADSQYGIAKAEGGELEADEFQDTYIGQECWVMNDIQADDYKGEHQSFVYIPEYDFATCVLTKFIDKQE